MLLSGLRSATAAVRRVSGCELRSHKLDAIMDELSQLNLLEINQLSKLLKEKYQIANVGVGNVVDAAPTKGQDSKSPAADTAEKNEYSIVLKSFNATSKAKVIKEIKLLLPSLNLVEAKAFVESAPKLVKDKLKKEEAELLKKTLEAAGATIGVE